VVPLGDVPDPPSSIIEILESSHSPVVTVGSGGPRGGGCGIHSLPEGRNSGCRYF